jgi:phosphotriesterase-related protein
MTVNGPVAPESAGRTLMHEHLFIDLNLPYNDSERWRSAALDRPTSASAIGIYNRPLTLEILERVEMGFVNRDNLILSDQVTAIEEAAEFKKQGGKTIVDVTSLGLDRHGPALRRLANATGLHVVMGTSWFSKAWYPANMDSRSVESLTEEIVRDITTGVGDTGIRSGIIGEVGAQGGPLTATEEKVLRASGRASRLTGAAVTLHTEGQQHEQSGIVDLLEAEGVDLGRVVVGHSNALAKDVSFARQLLGRGVYIQFDSLGRTPRINDPTSVSDTEVAKGIVDLIKAGYLERILMSQDVCTKIQLKSYGGSGYSYVLERFVPYLKRLGVTEAQIDTILVENPKRILTFRAPMRPARP